jgi:hypothetical protein
MSKKPSSLLANLNMGHLKIKALPKKPPPPVVIRAKMDQAKVNATLARILADRFVPFKSLTKARRDEIITYDQHFSDGRTNPLWLDARKDLATGSRLAGMIGWSPYEDEISTLMNMLWRTFKGNRATRWGTDNEPNAQSATESYFLSLNGTVNPANPKEIQVSSDIQEVGLVRSIAFPFSGMSPDGILTRTFRHEDTGEVRTQRQLLEFKCPFRHANLNDHWPAYDLYKKQAVPHTPGTTPSRVKLPLPQYYYTQLMWGGLIMGNHAMSSILENATVETPQLNKFMDQCDALSLPTRCGADLIQSEHPILFIVWVPCQRLKNEIHTPECYHTDLTNGSRFVRTRHGAFQLTEVDYNHEFAVWMMEKVYNFWRFKYMSRMVKKNLGILLKGELDVPHTISDSEDEEAESR